MTLARVTSCALAGIRGALVQVEVDIHHGLPNMTIVGLPDLAVRESKDRLYAAIRNAGLHYPQSRITVNLAPADVRKAGPAYDLPIALGVLVASGQLVTRLDESVVVGEVALDGSLRHTHGILPVAAAARSLGYRRIIVPRSNAAEAGLVGNIEVVAARDLKELVLHLSGSRALPPPPPARVSDKPPSFGVDLAHVRGQEHARRALEIAAAGGHNLLMSGLPGAGKTLLARAMPTIMPPLSLDEALEVTAVYSVAGCLPQDTPLVLTRPFRSPHHTVSNAGLIGGGSWPRPGEVSLAHHGVLFLDELPEFEPRVIEVLRQPLEDRDVTITRAAGTATFPAAFTLIAARNPCPCGYLGDDVRECRCTVAEIRRYTRRISGPLLDRIDMHVHVPRVRYKKLVDDSAAESSEKVRERVIAARERQLKRFETLADANPVRDSGVQRPMGAPTSGHRTGTSPSRSSSGTTQDRCGGTEQCNGGAGARPRRGGRKVVPWRGNPRAIRASDGPVGGSGGDSGDDPGSNSGGAPGGIATDGPWSGGPVSGPGASLQFDPGRRRVRCNGDMSAEDVRQLCRPTDEGAELLRTGMRTLGMSARAYHRVLKLARTIADLEGADEIDEPHVAEALQYQPRDTV